MVMNCFRPEDEAKRASKEIEKRILEWSRSFHEAVKILLLGAGEAGKTTIIKQMKILHISGFTEKERQEKAVEIRQNLHEAIYDLSRQAPLLQPPIILDFESSISAKVVQDWPRKSKAFSQTYYDHVTRLWADPEIQQCFNRASEFQLIDCAKYFLDRLSDIRKTDYIPSDKDILHCRKKTTSIQKVEFTVKIPKRFGGGSQEFWMFDVGGQRGERRKWIQAFEGIHAVLFLVACSSFDQVLREDDTTNRLQEALHLFEEVWDSRYLKDAGFILFLNKQDVLQQKIAAGRRLEKFFPDYADYQLKLKDGAPGDEYIKARAFIRDLFLDASRLTRGGPLDRRWSLGPGFVITPDGGPEKPRECYWHYTTAVDTRNVQTVFEDVHAMIISWNLQQVGIQ